MIDRTRLEEERDRVDQEIDKARRGYEQAVQAARSFELQIAGLLGRREMIMRLLEDGAADGAGADLGH